jgi:hypothetical protein
MKHSLGGKNGWCGVCSKKLGSPESNCPGQTDVTGTLIVKSGKNWGFCSDLCDKPEGTKQMKEKLNLQVPAEGLELVILHTQ